MGSRSKRCGCKILPAGKFASQDKSENCFRTITCRYSELTRTLKTSTKASSSFRRKAGRYLSITGRYFSSTGDTFSTTGRLKLIVFYLPASFFQQVENDCFQPTQIWGRLFKNKLFVSTLPAKSFVCLGVWGRFFASF